MCQIFGHFIESFPPEQDALELIFTPNSQCINGLWQNQRLSAHFVADYFSNFLPMNKEHPDENEHRVREMKGTVRYIANELLENAMKFKLDTPTYKVKFGIHFLDDTEVIAVMFTTNCIDRSGADRFRTFIQKLLISDPDDFYLQQIEASAADETLEMSGLGFITMLNDYNAKLGWKFETMQSDSEVIAVTTMAQVAV